MAGLHRRLDAIELDGPFPPKDRVDPGLHLVVMYFAFDPDMDHAKHHRRPVAGAGDASRLDAGAGHRRGVFESAHHRL